MVQMSQRKIKDDWMKEIGIKKELAINVSENGISKLNGTIKNIPENFNNNNIKDKMMKYLKVQSH